MTAMDTAAFDVRRVAPGVAALVCFAAYAVQQVRAQRAENIAWACHLGCALVGLGWLLDSASLNAIGLLWLLPGLAFWALYLAGGGGFKWTSCLTHVGGSTLGLFGAQALGVPPGAWWKAGLGYALLVLVSRRLSRPAENVNFSLQVWPGWEHRFPSHRRYVAGLVLGGFALFLALELLLRRFLPQPP
jgi:hypothetical protein